MSLTYGFYNSVNGDRKYNAQQMSALFDNLITDGVFDSIGDLFKVSPVSGMTVKVGAGRAWFNSTWTYNDSDYPLVVETSDIGLPRIDIVVLEVNATTSVRANSLKIVKGVAGSGVAPTLTNEGGLYQHALAQITVGAGVTEITAENIENKVGLEGTPFVTGILESVDISVLWAQWQARYDKWSNDNQTNFEEMISSKQTEFETWFSHLQDELDENQAANLQRQIDEIKTGGMFVVSASAPTETSQLWLDTTPTTGGLKYHNGTEWTHVPVAYT